MEYIEEITSLKNQVSFRGTLEAPEGIENVVIAGMGGSGIAGKIFQELYTKKPVSLVTSYDVPEFIGQKTLFVAISYSGNTEETIQAVNKAKKRGAQIRAISSGGKLAELVENTVIVPRGFQPRSAVGYLSVPLLRGFGLLDDKDVELTKNLLNDLDTHQSQFEKFGNDIFQNKSIPVIFGTPGLNAIAYRWKTQFNENAKVLAYSTSFPELNHNDTMALENTYRKDEFYFFVLTSRMLEKEISNRIRITSELCNIEMHKVEGEGNTVFANTFTLIHKGDYISYFLAKKRGVDPRDVAIIENLKRELAES
ncbi:MAG: bifunctional phosphoglucose/phosphomannose isomerase [Candidatus Thermoplasmatota archaeon]|jgi:glucose/mannose-6-phosphate isomerase|nr:bifunctional phosphoglucose/phosphomannose isomerase [Candidatus Thermoplasmatota archaeon]